MTTCTLLVENNRSELRSTQVAHGLSCYIRTDDKALLFDCGPDGTILYNAALMGIDLSSVDTVVLSHSHYDHSGGFPFLVKKQNVRNLYIGPRFFEPKLAQHGEVLTYLGCGFDAGFLQSHHIEPYEVSQRAEVAKNVWVVGGFSSLHSFEKIPEKFKKGTKQGIVPDLFTDEICLVVSHGTSLSMLVGCSHVGIASMVEKTEELFHFPVTKLYGGFHLGSSDDETIEKTLSALKECQVETLGMCHCSGERAIALAKECGKFTLSTIHTGDTVVL